MTIHDATEQAYKNGYEIGIKEFAERLKAKSTTEFWHGSDIRELSSPFVTIDKIDNLVKEMVGETK